MVIITDANGNIQAPTIPENVYQGSNLANEIVFLAPLSQSNSVVITFRKPNGVLVQELPMTPYTSVPSEYNLSAWRYVLEDAITDLYGQVSFQIKVRNGQGTTITSVAGTFPVLRGVPSIPSSDPSTSKWQAILDYVASIQADIDNGWLEARGLLPYHEDFEYSIGATIYDVETNSFYTSLVDNNLGNVLSDTSKWKKEELATPDDINNKISTHNNDSSAHPYLLANKQDKLTFDSYPTENSTNPVTSGGLYTGFNLVYNAITQKQNQLSSSQLDAVNSGIDSAKVSQIATNSGDIATINGKIMSGTNNTDNKLTNENFVNSSIATNTATFKGTYNIVTDLGLTTSATEQEIATALASEISSADDNDYCFVAYPDMTDPTQFTKYDRYKYNGSAWAYEYTLNNSSFTAQQWAAINSGITSQKVGDIDNKVDKTQLATKTISGLVYMWEDANGIHIWNTDPMQVNYSENNGVYEIRTHDYTENNGIYNIGGNE